MASGTGDRHYTSSTATAFRAAPAAEEFSRAGNTHHGDESGGALLSYSVEPFRRLHYSDRRAVFGGRRTWPSVGDAAFPKWDFGKGLDSHRQKGRQFGLRMGRSGHPVQRQVARRRYRRFFRQATSPADDWPRLPQAAGALATATSSARYAAWRNLGNGDAAPLYRAGSASIAYALRSLHRQRIEEVGALVGLRVCRVFNLHPRIASGAYGSRQLCHDLFHVPVADGAVQIHSMGFCS